MKNWFTVLFLLLISTCYAQDSDFHDNDANSPIKALESGVYDIKKVPSPLPYKILTGEKAQQAFHDLIMKDRELCDFFIYLEPEDETIIPCSREHIDSAMEYEIVEYSPDLQYVDVWHGAGAGFVYDIKNKVELCSNPKTYIESPSKKYRLGINAKYDGPYYNLEVREGNEYRCYEGAILGPEQLRQATNAIEFKNDYIYINANSVKGIYWEDEETIHFLVKEIDQQTQKEVWVAYSAKVHTELKE